MVGNKKNTTNERFILNHLETFHVSIWPKQRNRQGKKASPERLSVSLSLSRSLSVCLTLSPSHCLSLSLILFHSLFHSVCPSLSLSLSLSLCVCVCLSVSRSLPLIVSRSRSLSLSFPEPMTRVSNLSVSVLALCWERREERGERREERGERSWDKQLLSHSPILLSTLHHACLSNRVTGSESKPCTRQQGQLPSPVLTGTVGQQSEALPRLGNSVAPEKDGTKLYHNHRFPTVTG